MYYLLSFVYEFDGKLVRRLAEVYSQDGDCEKVLLCLLREQYPTAEYIISVEPS
jgi:hypothetical protein